MRRLLRSLLFVVAVGFAIAQQVNAAAGGPSCESLVGVSCAPPGASTHCVWNDGAPGLCKCSTANRWVCIK